MGVHHTPHKRQGGVSTIPRHALLRNQLWPFVWNQVMQDPRVKIQERDGTPALPIRKVHQHIDTRQLTLNEWSVPISKLKKGIFCSPSHSYRERHYCAVWGYMLNTQRFGYNHICSI
jgi:hypothetical protein